MRGAPSLGGIKERTRMFVSLWVLCAKLGVLLAMTLQAWRILMLCVCVCRCASATSLLTGALSQIETLTGAMRHWLSKTALPDCQPEALSHQLLKFAEFAVCLLFSAICLVGPVCCWAVLVLLLFLLSALMVSIREEVNPEGSNFKPLNP